MSIQSEVERLEAAKSALKTAINAKGGTLTTQSLSAYGAAVSGLPSGVSEPYTTYTLNSDGEVIGAVVRGFTTYIPNNMFRNWYVMASCDFPNTVTEVRKYAFAYCNALVRSELPPNLTTLGEYAFYECKKWTITSIPAGITYIPMYAFGRLPLLTIDIIASNITKIETYSFSEDPGLTNIEIACGYVSQRSFSGCTNLKKVWIRSTCTTIYSNYASTTPFPGCPDDLVIYCEPTSKPDGWGQYFNRTGSSGGVTATVVWGQTTRPW